MERRHRGEQGPFWRRCNAKGISRVPERSEPCQFESLEAILSTYGSAAERGSRAARDPRVTLPQVVRRACGAEFMYHFADFRIALSLGNVCNVARRLQIDRWLPHPELSLWEIERNERTRWKGGRKSTSS